MMSEPHKIADIQRIAAQQERAAVVAWLRAQLGPVERIDDWINSLIDAIEAGQHLKTEGER